MTTPCCQCGGEKYRRLPPVASRLDAREFTPVECRGCGLVGLEPRLPLPELFTYYDGLGEDTRQLEDKIRERFKPRVDWVIREAGATGRMLDVGCSWGQFPGAMKAAGWRAEGVETDEAKAASGRAEFGVPIHNEPFDTWAGPGDGTYDAITAWHVVEHFVDPAKVLARAAALLTPDTGRLFIEVPNYRSLGRAWGGPHWLHYDVPYHQHFFSPRTLRALAEKAGLEVLWVSRGALDSDWWSLKRTLQRRVAGTPLVVLKPLISMKPVAWLLAKLGGLFGYTETFQLMARRKR